MSEDSLASRRLFIETDIKLQSALSFTQYALPLRRDAPDFRLVTLIGEDHELEFSCGDPQITVAEYTIDTLRSNHLAEVLLEIDQDFITHEKLWPHSVPIREILKAAKKDASLLQRIKGYDWRNYWLGADQRELLYHNMKKIETLSQRELVKRYIKVFQRSDSPFRLSKSAYDPEVYLFLTVSLPRDFNETLVSIHQKVSRVWEGGERKSIILDLQHFWKSVTDWNILKELFKQSATDSIVSIMGDQHQKSIAEILQNIPKLSSQEGGKDNCVSLLQTIYIK